MVRQALPDENPDLFQGAILNGGPRPPSASSKANNQLDQRKSEGEQTVERTGAIHLSIKHRLITSSVQRPLP
jgi:hypothetical protein